MKHYFGNSFCSDPLVFMSDLEDRIEREFQLREAQEQRRLEEPEYQSIRLELLIAYRQTLDDLQTRNRKAEKKAKLRKAIGEKLKARGVSPGEVGGQETEEEKISIVIDKLNKDILLREAQEQRRLEEPEYQSIRLELLIGYRQTLDDLQTRNRKAEKKAKLRKAVYLLVIGEKLKARGVSPGEVGGQETEEEKISIVIDKLNKDILVSTKNLSRSREVFFKF
ncbi:hypothetical protein NHX12_001457 [Muraenolepis orangiensis]|uniref:Uncharacterized protein n=1 Tax=Muraenolepis orangiensis TaxID=630683 RepID=A0A9Q0IEZ7_9TELE|nr:hypothetical protein NHX12_001457 [Muraenolepis orangiensis]